METSVAIKESCQSVGYQGNHADSGGIGNVNSGGYQVNQNSYENSGGYYQGNQATNGNSGGYSPYQGTQGLGVGGGGQRYSEILSNNGFVL
ncbi:unnamed protein product [Arabidopsis thaliana]|uniref:Glycine-rich protein n=1 Tax=Arabidopsis thaliana TaxID=3702 RepID=A0A654EG61_ARATH|nr:unnamed protein product [Arabidopsis thaliana]